MKRLRLPEIASCVLLLICVLAGGVSFAAKPSAGITVIYGSKGKWIDKHAAEEFAKYVKLTTGSEPRVLTDKTIESNPAAGRSSRIVLVGNASSNAIINRLEKRNRFTLPQAILGTDGFVVKSVRDKGKNYLVLAGADDRGTLYAVYGYLSNYCGAGFFMDGERISRLKRIPFIDVSLIEKPRFPLRFHNIPSFRGMNKYQSTSWNLSDWKMTLDRLATQKINCIGMPMGFLFQTPLVHITAKELGYPLPPEKDEAVYNAGWPESWYWPDDYTIKLAQGIIGYARALGMRVMLPFAYGGVTRAFEQKYTQFKYADIGNYESQQFDPDEPMLQTFMKKEVEVTIRLLGKPNWYFASPYSEAIPGGTVEDSARIKAKAGERFIELLRSVDPRAVFVEDTWAYSEVPPAGSDYKYTIENYLNTFKNDAFFTYDTSAECHSPVPLYKTFNYFYGKNWAFGVLHSMSSSDNPHGDMIELTKRVKEVSADPKAKTCRGVWMIPEAINTDVAYFDLAAQLAWDPDRTNADSFLKDYCSRRYGGSPEMLAAWKLLLTSVYSKFFEGEEYCGSELAYYTGNSPFYKFSGMGFGGPNAFPLFSTDQDKKIRESYVRDIPRMLPSLEKAIDILVSQRESQKGNVLYENDLINLTKYYIGQVSDWYLLKSYEAFEKGDKAELDEDTQRVDECLLGIKKILHTRKDYSLQETIDQGMAVRGANTYLPEMIKQSTQNRDYLNQDSYEQLFYYRAKVDVYLDELKNRLEMGENTIVEPMIDAPWEKVGEDWVKTVQPKFQVDGEPVQVTTQMFSQIKKYGDEVR